MLFYSVLSLLAFYQENPQPVVTEELRVTYVMLDVVALDKKGRLVDDLTLSDFQVTENGQPVEPAYFDTLDYRADAPLPDMSDVPEEYRPANVERPLRQVILAMDMEQLKLFEARRAFKQIRFFLNTLDGSQRVAVNMYDMDRGSLSKGFLEDRETLLTLLAQYEDRYMGKYLDRRSPWNAPDSGPMLLVNNDQGSSWGSDLRKARGGPTTERGNQFTDLEAAFRSCAMMGGVDCVQDRLEEYLQDQRDRTDRILGQLELLAYDFKEEKGLKIIFFLSPGFTMDNHFAARELAQKYGVGDNFMSVDQGFASNNQFQRVVHASIKNRVIFNTFDIFNGRLGHQYRSYTNEMDRSLRALARESGGAFSSKSHLKASMNKALEKNRFFYVIGYNSPQEGDPEVFRKIKLKVKRKGVKLRHRKGYFVK